uniref:Aspartyl/asparaginyl beta-hydroxylase n=1 Tax=Lygus hesperus TaxID=30085 RepID=A0A0A9ZHD0_LYGHE
MQLLSLEVIPEAIFLSAAKRAINRLRFRGLHMKAALVHKKLIDRFDDIVEYRNDLGINYLMVNRLSDAENVFLETLSRWPDDPVARSHYGLVLKLTGRTSESIPHLQRGLATNHPATRDARLYFHLGDALSRDGQTEEAMKVHKAGVEKGLFRSEYQRSLYNVDHLTARPWWTLKQTTYAEFFKMLETNWKVIRDEGLSAMKLKGLYQDEAENLRDVGDWKQFQLFARGNKYAENCKKTPVTCKLIGDFSPARGCKRGQSKFSVMDGGTHVWPHCGPTNCRLRAHLGLVVPPGPAIRVADDTRKWVEGKVIVFDDSFEHEVWHNGTALRLVLIVDVWHPDLSPAEKATLSPI